MPTPLYASKAEWIAGIKNWVSTDDQPDLDTAMFLYLANLRLNRELQSVPMEASVDIPITVLASPPVSAAAGVPFTLLDYIPDFNKIRLVLPYAYGEPADVIAINEMAEKISKEYDLGYAYQYTGPDRNIKNYYAIDAGQLYLSPWYGDGATLTIKYYREVPPLTDLVDTNIFTMYHSDLFLYACLIAASEFVVEDERIPMWKEAYAQSLESTNNTHKHQKMGSTVLKRQITGLS